MICLSTETPVPFLGTYSRFSIGRKDYSKTWIIFCHSWLKYHSDILLNTKESLNPLSKFSRYYMRGGSPKWNYLLEGGPLQYRLLLLGECSRNPSCIHVPAGVVVRGGERLQRKNFEDCFDVFPHLIMGDSQVHLPRLHWMFCSFWPKTAWPSRLTLCIHLIWPLWLFLFFSLDEKKSSKGNILLMWKRWNKKQQKH